MAKISVIVPVFRASGVIITCLESLLKQTLQSLEIIFVDDHGDDDSFDVLRKYLQNNDFQLVNDYFVRDEICIFLTQTPCNSGPGEARNIGIEKATGEYIAFVDADDWVEADMFEILYANAQQYDAQLSCTNVIMDYNDGTSRILANPKVSNGTLSVAQKKYLLTHYISNFYSFIYQRSWLNAHNLRFPKGKSGEDSCFMACCYLSAERIAQNDCAMYHYIIYPDSISHRKFVWRGKQKRESFVFLFDYAKKNGLMEMYRWQIYWIYFKKALVTPILELLRDIIK